MRDEHVEPHSGDAIGKTHTVGDYNTSSLAKKLQGAKGRLEAYKLRETQETYRATAVCPSMIQTSC